MTTDETRAVLVRETRSHVIRSIQYRLVSGMLDLMAKSSTSEVARYFTEENPTWGEPQDEEHGVLAEWARKICETEIVEFDRYEIVKISETFERLDVTIHGGSDDVYEIFIPIGTDSPLQRFLQEFDDGAFPDLTEDAYRELLKETED